MTKHRVLLDTGVLVALHLLDDPRHDEVVRWLAAYRGELHTVEAVLSETAFFLPPRHRSPLAGMAAGGRLSIQHLDSRAHARMGELFRKYADQDPDWADLALVWLAESSGISRIATFDVADFGVYRINGRKRFELELLR